MRTLRNRKSYFWLGFVALPLGCQVGAATDEMLDAAPELGAVQMEFTGDVNAESLAGEADMVDAASGVADVFESMGGTSSGELAEGLVGAHEAISNFNNALRSFLEPVVGLLREEATRRVGRLAVWGPVVRGATEYRVTIRRGAERRFGWLLEARAEGADEEFVNVAAGSIVVDGTPRRGAGVAGFDLDALQSVDATTLGRGQLLVGFAHGALGTTLSYTAKDFTPDVEKHEPIDARWKGIHFKEGLNVVRLAYRGNLSSTASGAEELVLARGRHLRGQGGRIDALVTGGDIAEDKVFVKSECYDRGGVLAYSIVRECSQDAIDDEKRCSVLSKEGELKSCLPDFLEEALPPLNGNAEESDDAPNESVEPPSEMPDGMAPSEG